MMYVYNYDVIMMYVVPVYYDVIMMYVLCLCPVLFIVPRALNRVIF